MDENTQKFEIKIDPLDFHVGLKDNMAEFAEGPADIRGIPSRGTRTL